MRARQSLPHLWLMTDERADASLIAALHRLPRGSGVVFRHHATPPAARRRRFEEVRRIARSRGLLLLLAGSQRQARAWGADGAHGREALRGPGTGLVTASAHDTRELRRAATAHLLFVSPVFATRSHPGARPLGAPAFARLARAATQPVIALGGMNAERGYRLLRLGAWGWAAIDAWSRYASRLKASTPAQAGVQLRPRIWTPAFAGVDERTRGG